MGLGDSIKNNPTAWGAGLAGAAGIGGIISNAILARQGKNMMKSGEAAFNTSLNALRSGQFDASVSQGMLQSAEEQKRLSAQTAKTAEERARAAQQSFISSLRSGDRRMAASLPSVYSSMEQGAQQAQSQAAREQSAANQQIAGLEEQYKQQNIANQRALEEMMMQRGAASAEAGRQQRAGAIGGIFSGIGDLGTTLLTAGLGKDGMKVQKTPGEFSHEKNPIHMVAKDGRKVGEVTGGEYVFNPAQSNKIKDMIGGGDKEGLYVYMKDLLSKNRFK